MKKMIIIVMCCIGLFTFGIGYAIGTDLWNGFTPKNQLQYKQ